MNVTVNELSHFDAEVVLDGEGWEVSITALVSLDEGFFESFIATWIGVTNEYNQPIDSSFLAGQNVEQDINAAISEYRQEAAEDYAYGLGDSKMECRREEEESR